MEHSFSYKQIRKRDAGYMALAPYILAAMRAKFDIRVEGADNIPDEPAMFVANHLRFADSLIGAAVYTQRKHLPLRLGAKSGYFEGTGIDDNGKYGFLMKQFVTRTGQIPVYREDVARGFAVLSNETKKAFDSGESVLLHAEGTRSLDGKLNKFKTGAASLAIKNMVPIVPMSFSYGEPTGNIWKRTPVEVAFGEPLEPLDYGLEIKPVPHVPQHLVETITRTARTVRRSERIHHVTDVLEQRVSELSGQERSGVDGKAAAQAGER